MTCFNEIEKGSPFCFLFVCPFGVRSRGCWVPGEKVKVSDWFGGPSCLSGCSSQGGLFVHLVIYRFGRGLRGEGLCAERSTLRSGTTGLRKSFFDVSVVS